MGNGTLLLDYGNVDGLYDVRSFEAHLRLLRNLFVIQVSQARVEVVCCCVLSIDYRLL